MPELTLQKARGNAAKLLPQTKHFVVGAFAISIAFLGFLIFQHFRPPKAARVYRIGYGNSAPFQYKAADGTPTGVAVEIVREAARRRNISLQWVEPPSNGFDAVVRGQCDIWVLLTDLPERHNQIYISEPYMTVEHTFVVLKSGTPKTSKDLETARIAYQASWSLNPRDPTDAANADRVYITKAFPKAKPVPIVYRNANDILDLLRLGQADAGLIDKNIAAALLLASGSRDEVDVVAAPDGTTQLALGATFSAQKAAEEIRGEMRSMAEDGFIASIAERWGTFESGSLDVIKRLAALRRLTLILEAAVAALIVAMLFAVIFLVRLRYQRDAVSAAAEERRLLQAAREETNRLESLGRLAGGVAHDFNNLLTVINGYSGRALAGTTDEARVRKYLEGIQAAGERAAGIVRQLLAFSRNQILQPQILDLNSVVIDMQQMMQASLGAQVQIRVHLSPEPVWLYADKHQIQQVIMNLAINARDAMPRGGELFIETSMGDFIHGLEPLCGSLRPGRYVFLSVRDTGVGIDEITREHIFEPFFTTKESGRGTGLGLSVVKGIAEQSGGCIEVETAPQRGTAFKVYFPEATGPASSEEKPEPRVETQGHETVLVVDDQPEIVGLLVESLTAGGYHVIPATSGAEAVAVFQKQDIDVHLVLADLKMPQMSGIDLVEVLSKKRPGFKALFMSGYGDDVSGFSSAQNFIQKPFDAEELIAKVRQVLDEHNLAKA